MTEGEKLLIKELNDRLHQAESMIAELYLLLRQKPVIKQNPNTLRH